MDTLLVTVFTSSNFSQFNNLFLLFVRFYNWIKQVRCDL